MNTQGILIGAAAFLIIGIFHPIVVKGEYHFGKKIWPIFLVAGLICLGASLFIEHTTWGAIVGVFGFASLWGIRELYKQAERVERGWFPKKLRQD